MIHRRRGQSIVFPQLNSFFYVYSFGTEDVDIGIVTPEKRYRGVLKYRLSYSIYQEHPEIEVIAFHTEAHRDVGFSLKAPREIDYERGEEILNDFEPSARFEENGTLVLGQMRYKLVKTEGHRYRSELII